MSAPLNTSSTFAGHFMVAFVDLLGTDAKNAEIKAQPEFPATLLEQEVNKVKSFRTDFRKFFEAAKLAENRLKTQRPESLRTAFKELQGNAVISNSFSDSLIFYASLNTVQNCKVPVDSCYLLLTALASAQLSSLARGHPFRGGIEVGRAAQFGGNQLLGPALSDAVWLEKQAKFPRILIGKEFVKYLELNSLLPPTSHENQASIKFAKLCLSLFCVSDEPTEHHKHGETSKTENHIWSIDIKSDHFANLVGPSYQALLKRATDFAEREFQRFTGHDEKLACRYSHLLNYLNGER